MTMVPAIVDTTWLFCVVIVPNDASMLPTTLLCHLACVHQISFWTLNVFPSDGAVLGERAGVSLEYPCSG